MCDKHHEGHIEKSEKRILSPEETKRFIEEGQITWVEAKDLLDATAESCVDGRGHDGIVGTPGGNAGEFILALTAVEKASGQKLDLDKGLPKVSYLKQLAIYMDGLDLDLGYLIQAHFKDNFIIDEIYQFTLKRNEDGNFSSGAISFNINDTYKKWARLYNQNIVPKIEPKSEYRYKYPIEEIDWKSLSSSKIGSARNNRAVIGDWQVIYSDYKNLIIEREGSTLGYTDKELELINALTKGYTSKSWKGGD